MGENTDIMAVTRAIVIEPDLFFTSGDKSEERIPLDRRLLGVPVIVRTLRQLQDAGVRHSTVILPESLQHIEGVIRSDFRIKHDLEFSFVAGSAENAMQQAAAIAEGPLVVARGDFVAPGVLLTEWFADGIESGVQVLTEDPDQVARERRLSFNESRFLLGDPEEARLRLLGVLLLADDVRRELAEGGDLAKAINSAAAADQLAVRTVGERWAVPVYAKSSWKRVEERLLISLRKPIDGFIARSINRRISIPISRRLANTFLTPNMASSFTLVLAALAVWALLHGMGNYWWTLLAATLFQFASIIDGVDGELARLKYQFTKYGEWVDTVIDDISNYSFFAALTYVSYHIMTGDPTNTAESWPWVVAFGFLTIGCYTFITPLMYAYIIKYTDSGDVMAIDFSFNKLAAKHDENFFIRFMHQLKNLAKRDFFIFMIFVFALFGNLPRFMFVSGSVAVIILFAVLMQHRKKRAQLAEQARRTGALDEEWRTLTRQPDVDTHDDAPFTDAPENSIVSDEKPFVESDEEAEPESGEKQG